MPGLSSTSKRCRNQDQGYRAMPERRRSRRSKPCRSVSGVLRSHDCRHVFYPRATSSSCPRTTIIEARYATRRAIHDHGRALERQAVQAMPQRKRSLQHASSQSLPMHPDGPIDLIKFTASPVFKTRASVPHDPSIWMHRRACDRASRSTCDAEHPRQDKIASAPVVSLVNTMPSGSSA